MLLEAARALADALARENAALLAMDFSQVTPLAAEKAHALVVFTAAQAGAAGPFTPAERRALHDAATRLTALVAENKQMLECAIQVQGRVLAAIAAALPRALPQPAAGYRANGAMAKASRTPPMSLSARA